MIKSQLADTTDERSEHVAFGMYDQKGREIGAIIKTSIKEFKPADAEDTWGSSLEPGRYYTAWMQATRDGGIYGALQSSQHFTTEAARAAAIATYLESAKSRAAAKARKLERQAREQAARICRP